jgi:hypothetical protein
VNNNIAATRQLDESTKYMQAVPGQIAVYGCLRMLCLRASRHLNPHMLHAGVVHKGTQQLLQQCLQLPCDSIVLHQVILHRDLYMQGWQ